MSVLTSSCKASERVPSSFCTCYYPVMSLMRNNCHSPLTSDDICVPVETVAFQDTKQTHSSTRRQLVERNNRPKSLIFSWRFRQIYKLHLQEGSPGKCITSAHLTLIPSPNLKLNSQELTIKGNICDLN